MNLKVTPSDPKVTKSMRTIVRKDSMALLKFPFWLMRCSDLSKLKASEFAHFEILRQRDLIVKWDPENKEMIEAPKAFVSHQWL